MVFILSLSSASSLVLNHEFTISLDAADDDSFNNDNDDDNAVNFLLDSGRMESGRTAHALFSSASFCFYMISSMFCADYGLYNR